MNVLVPEFFRTTANVLVPEFCTWYNHYGVCHEQFFLDVLARIDESEGQGEAVGWGSFIDLRCYLTVFQQLLGLPIFL